MPPLPEFNNSKSKSNKSSKSTTPKPLPVLSPYSYHLEHYKSGCGSADCAGSTICFARGQVPSDIVCIGESPGESENVLGMPFVGPAGELLDDMIERAFHTFEVKPRILFTNNVGCIPRESDGAKAGVPSHEQMELCKPRLQELLIVADGKDPRKDTREIVENKKRKGFTEREDKPIPYLHKKGTLKAIIAVGVEARDHLDPKYHHSVKLHRPIPIHNITHPAALLRRNVVQRNMDIDRVIVTLYNIWANILDPNSRLTTS